MEIYSNFFFTVWIRFFFLLTPFFVLSIFLAMTPELTAAVLCVGVLLLCASSIEQVVGKKGITILSKLTGLFVAALAAQIVFTGVKNFLMVK